MKVEKIDHIHIAVKDLRKAVKFFADIMGTKWYGPMEPPADMIAAFDSLGLELVQPTSTDGAVARFIQKRGEGVFSIGIKVPNIDEACAELEAKGVRVVEKGVTNESLKYAITHPKDSFGIMFELLEYDERLPIVLANLNVDKVMKVPKMA